MPSRLALAAAVGVTTAVAAAFALFVVAAVRVGADPPPDSAVPTAAADADVLAALDGYAVWGRQDDATPVRWNPCEPIRWAFDGTDAPPGVRQVVTRAIARVSAATGLTFEDLGDVTERPSLSRPLTMPTADGAAWAPVLVTWVAGGSTDLPLGEDERGVTVPVAVQDGGPRVFVTGQVVLNADKTLHPAFEDRHASWGAVVLHEVMHLVGLDHVQDSAQLMHPTPGFGPVVLGDGDMAGLTAVGAAGGCLPTPRPQELVVDFG